MEETRFTYVVNPRRPIRLPNMPAIKSSKTLKLTKEEALLCMKCGPVYRKFANEGHQERITNANIDRLHSDKFISEKEYNGFDTIVHTNPAPVPVEEKAEEVVVEQPKVEEKVVEPEPVKEEVKEQPVEVEVTAESADTVEAVDQNVDDVADEITENGVSTSDEVEEDESDSEEAAEENDSVQEEANGNNQQNSNITVDYSGNRKKKKHRN